MYVTRPLSQLLRSPELLAAPPPDGPNTGYLVIQDEDSVTYTCFGCKNQQLTGLPFPQDKELVVQYTSGAGENFDVSRDPIFLIPLLNHPLSSNRYHAIVPHGKRIGEAFTCSREEDKTPCCFCRCVKDVKPRPLDPCNVYQQFEIAQSQSQSQCTSGGYFSASSIASDGFPPYFLRLEGWTIDTKTPRDFKLDTAQGLDSRLRAKLTAFDFPQSRESSEASTVGKWYSPFVFVKEGTLRDQVKRSMYYELTLVQWWERVFACHNNGNDARVSIDVVLENEEVVIGGSKSELREKRDGVIWFTSRENVSVGLREELVEGMKWEQERGGWVRRGDDERQVRIQKVEECKEGVGWNEFGCYILVERFNLRRCDGSLVMSYDFRHFHQMRNKWW